MRVRPLTWTAGGWSGDPAGGGGSRLFLIFGDADEGTVTGPLAALAERHPGAVIAGCSGSARILGDRVHEDRLVAAEATFDHTTLRHVWTPISGVEDSEDAGRRVARALRQLATDGPPLRYVLVLADGVALNGTRLVRGITAELGPEVVVTGGLAGDGARFEGTWVLADGLPRRGAVSALGFFGDRLEVGHGSKGGWDVFGPERVITRSEDNVLLELDGRPALALYKEYLGERAAGLPATALLFPLAIRPEGGTGPTLVRTILGIDEERSSLTMAGDVPTGHRAQLMRANFDRLVEGASGAALASRADGDDPVLALAVSCIGRRIVLGERIEEEVEATLAELPRGSVQVGFYSHGELSPIAAGTCELHNQTMTMTTLRER